jgi:hypothetical protein
MIFFVLLFSNIPHETRIVAIEGETEIEPSGGRGEDGEF